MVHLRFASELKYVNLGSRNIVAKIVDGSKDFVAVKAREAFGECTSMSCLEASGAMHTFIVAYREHPSRLEIDTRSAQSLPSFSTSNADGGLTKAKIDELVFDYLPPSYDHEKKKWHVGNILADMKKKSQIKLTSGKRWARAQ